MRMSKGFVAVTVGDPAGIGPEIVLKSFQEVCGFTARAVVVGEMSVLKTVRDRLGIDVELTEVREPEEAKGRAGVVSVLNTAVVESAAVLREGEVSSLGGEAAVAAVRRAVGLASKGRVEGIVTGPINKESLREASFHYIGHTEMLSELSGVRGSVTMFTVDRMKIFFHTRHVSLAHVLANLSVERVVESIVQAHRCLLSIGSGRGVLALAALNPHASDGGLFGEEEAKILLPACREAGRRGVKVEGPVPADSVFHHALQGRYDGVVSLYHDQGHIAAKTYDFFRTVSVTLGLPFIRTSVDHGTAFDIAWKGIANAQSMVEALNSCFDLSTRYVPFSL
jgi:4-hydroxythreonine-4-phosphate dehydrogenase